MIFVGTRQDSRGCLCTELQGDISAIGMVNFTGNDLHAELDDYSIGRLLSSTMVY